MNLPEAIVFMKIGFHGEETLSEIVERKRQEEAVAGVMFWGYGGPLFHPMTQPFAADSASP